MSRIFAAVIVIFSMLYSMADPSTGLAWSMSYSRQQVYIPSKNEWLEAEDFINRTATKALIFIGEVHSNPLHHEVQLFLLKEITKRYGPINLGMEALGSNVQDTINRFLEGELSEQRFLRETDWDRTWGFPFSFYRPLMDVVREAGGSVFGISPQWHQIKGLARSLGASASRYTDHGFERPFSRITFEPRGYGAYVKRAYESLESHRATGDLQQFFLSQSLRDEFMAQSIVAKLTKEPRKTIVIAGNSHILNYWGIPRRVLHHLPLPLITLLIYSQSHLERLEGPIGDFVWVTDGNNGP